MSGQQFSLFKYMSSATAMVVLKGGRLRWSRPSRFNDPFDMQVNLQMRIERDRVIQATLDKTWDRCNGKSPPARNVLGQLLDLTGPIHLIGGRHDFDRTMRPGLIESLDKIPDSLRVLNQEVLRELAGVKILCLSAVRDSILMWSHYAENHKGLVLEFHQADGVDSPYKMARDVEYLTDVPNLLDEEELSDFLSGGLNIDAKLTDRVLYSKAAPWSYEHEWRISTGRGRDPLEEHEDIPFHPRELRAVYFGCKTPGPARDEALDLIGKRYPHAELWQCVRNLDAWALGFEQL